MDFIKLCILFLELYRESDTWPSCFGTKLQLVWALVLGPLLALAFVSANIQHQSLLVLKRDVIDMIKYFQNDMIDMITKVWGNDLCC